MRLRPSGTTALLVELDDLDQVLAYHAALAAAFPDGLPDGLLDVVPAARTVLLVLDPDRLGLEQAAELARAVEPRSGDVGEGELLELPVVYDGEDLDEVASLLGCSAEEVVRRHTGQEWRVAFCGFAPGFGYLISTDGGWDVPRRSDPRTRVPAGSVGLAGEFSGVYPRESPGGWQLIGRTSVSVFDLDREPAALLQPRTRVRFVEEGRS